MNTVSKSPRILVVAPDLPYPIRAGGQMRMASLTQAMAQIGTVHIACIAPDVPPETRAWAAGLGATLAHCPRPRAHDAGWRLWMKRARAVLSSSNLVFDRSEKAFFDRQFAEFGPNLVWLETPYLLRDVLDWQDSVPIVVDYWGTSGGARRDWQRARGPARAWEWLRWRSAAGSERKYAPRVSDIVSVSELDAQYFRSIALRSRVWVIPNGIVKKLGARDLAAQPEDPDLMIMTGDQSYRPNVDAACHFVEKIFPRIRDAHPAAKANLIGRDPAPRVQALAQCPGITVKGYVPDLAAEISRAAVYILPMRLGSGIRSKLFDVFPLGKPIVSTTVGAEGLELVHGENVMIADSPAEFADACVRLLRDAGERERLGAEVRELAERVYSQENIARLVEKAVRSILQGG
ncbi:MAG: glycosyltransferase [Kiritimatiellae bacterium]|nr:glycosyltransferase [Kiritimatiellia bacterium]